MDSKEDLGYYASQRILIRGEIKKTVDWFLENKKKIEISVKFQV